MVQPKCLSGSASQKNGVSNLTRGIVYLLQGRLFLDDGQKSTTSINGLININFQGKFSLPIDDIKIKSVSNLQGKKIQ